MKDLFLRTARADDYETLAALKMNAAQRFGVDYVSRALGRGVFEREVRRGQVLVAERPKGVVGGYAIFWDEGADVFLYHLFVHMDFARQGWGRALVEEVVGRAKRTQKRAVTLITGGQIPWNAPYYARLGFQLVEEAAPDYLAAHLKEDRENFDVAKSPWVSKCPWVLPRVAMQCVL